MVSSYGMLVKRLSSSKLAMIQLASKLTTSSANEKESWTVNSLTVKGTVMQIEKVLINDRLRVSKVS